MRSEGFFLGIAGLGVVLCLRIVAPRGSLIDAVPFAIAAKCVVRFEDVKCRIVWQAWHSK